MAGKRKDAAADALASDDGVEEIVSDGGKFNLAKAVGAGKTRLSPKMPNWWQNWSGAMKSQASIMEARFGVVSTGSIALDYALGLGGVPLGCEVGIFGKEGSAKTTFVQTIVGNWQRSYPDYPIVWVIGEKHSNAMAQRNGVNLSKIGASEADFKAGKNLAIFRPSLKNGLTYVSIAIAIEQIVLASKVPVLAIIDSLDSMISDKEMQSNPGNGNVGGNAKFNSEWLKRMENLTAETGSLLIFTQQLRDVVNTGGMPGFSMGPKTKTSGGWAAKYYPAVRIELTPTDKETDAKTGEVLAQNVKVTTRKNEFYRPHVATTVTLRYAYDEIDPGGIDRASEIIRLAKELQLVAYSQPMYVFNDIAEEDGGNEDGIAKSKGMEAARRFILEHPAVMERLYNDIRSHLSGGAEVVLIADDPQSVVGDADYPGFEDDDDIHDQ